MMCSWDWSGPMLLCTQCKETLTATEVEHGLEGFGHQGVCCRCYEDAMRGTPRGKKK